MKHPPAALVHVAFFLSGATSLVLQVVWSKALSLRLGSTLHAVSTVVAVYLAGLALGAWLAGRTARRLRRPLLGYGLLEIGVGLYALVSLSLLALLDPLLDAAYVALGSGSLGYLTLRAGVSAAVLLPATVLMGATLPWLVAWTSPSGARFAAGLARLYGVNTLGAVSGVILAGFFLIPGAGLVGSLRTAGLTAIGVGALMALLGIRAREDRTVESRAAASVKKGVRGAVKRTAAGADRTAGPHDGLPTGGRRMVGGLLFGLSGGVALALEMIWTRMFGLIFGSSVYSFALVLAAYLLGVAVGSAFVGSRAASGSRPWRMFAALQLAVAAGVAAGLWLLPELPRMFIALLITFRERLPVVYTGQALLAGLVVFVPCLAFGALFPVGARLLAGGDSARSTGRAYAVNTAGTLAGTLLAAFVLLPRVGMHPTLIALVLLPLLLAGVAWLAEPQPPAFHGRLALTGVVLAAIVAVTALLAPSWNRALFTLGAYRYPGGRIGEAGAGEEARRVIRQVLDEERLLYYREGVHSVVSVHTYEGRESKRTLRINGKPDAGSGDDMSTQIMLGHVPMLWTAPGARVAVIGLGSGVTVRATLAFDPASVTVVEIEPAVLEAQRWFAPVNEHAVDDPRVRVLLEDAREYLLHTDTRFDMIVSEPSNPWMAGVNNLFTVEFYRRVRDALAPGGVFCQWVQFYGLSQRTMGSLLRTFAHVFPDGEAFLFDKDLLLVSPSSQRKVPAERLLLEDHGLAPPADYAARFGFHGNGYVAGHHAGRVSYLVGLLPDAPLNTDDRPFVEYASPFDLYRIDPGSRLEDIPDWFEPDALSGLARWVQADDLVQVALAVGTEWARTGRPDRTEQLAQGLDGRPDGHVAAQTLRVAADEGRRALQVASEVARLHALVESNELEAAEPLIAEILRVDPGNAATHLLAGRVAMRRDRLDPARSHLAETVRDGSPSQRCAALNNLGIIAMRQGQAELGRSSFEAARGAHPGQPDSYLNLARWYLQAGDVETARSVLQDGLERAFPVDQLEASLAELP